MIASDDAHARTLQNGFNDSTLIRERVAFEFERTRWPDGTPRSAKAALRQAGPVMWRIVLAVTVLALAAQARANDVPELVRRFLDDAKASCAKAGGKPEPNPEISGVDLNGDGHTDWVVHYKGYCPGAPGHFCRDGDCMFEIFVGQPEGGPRLFINQSAITWRTARVRGLPALIFHRPSQYCARGKRACDETYVFDRNGAMRHLR